MSFEFKIPIQRYKLEIKYQINIKHWIFYCTRNILLYNILICLHYCIYSSDTFWLVCALYLFVVSSRKTSLAF